MVVCVRWVLCALVLIAVATLSTGCGKSEYQKAEDDLTKSTHELVLATDRQRIVEAPTLSRMLEMTRAFLADIDRFELSDSDRREQIKKGLFLVIGVCDDCERLLDSAQP